MNTAVVLVLFAVLVALVQLAWARVQGRLDPRLVPSRSRGRVRWLALHARGIELTALAVALAALATGAGLRA